MSDDVGARKLGEKLLVEVEVEGLSSVLRSVRDLNLRRDRSETTQPLFQPSFSGIPELDSLLPNLSQPILELISPPVVHHPSGAGKTSLLYLIIAHAILPSSLSSSIALGGQNAMVFIFDPLHHISISRLASVTLHLLRTRILAAKTTPLDETLKADLETAVKHSLNHVHIFRPQTWSALQSTLHALPTYLFDGTKHKSMHRRVHSVILEDIDSFASAIRTSTSTSYTSAGSEASNRTTANANRNPNPDPNPLSTASLHLTTHLHALSAVFQNATILTSHSVSPNTFRPALPISWPQRSLPEVNAVEAVPHVHAHSLATVGVVVTRLALRRVEVLKFAPAISVEEAEAERRQRWEVVSRGRFECWKIGGGGAGGGRDGEGFVFRVGGKGAIVVEEREEGK